MKPDLERLAIELQKSGVFSTENIMKYLAEAYGLGEVMAQLKASDVLKKLQKYIDEYNKGKNK
jgi:hypothetical protein